MTPTQKPIQISYYKTNVGNFFTINSGNTYGYNTMQSNFIVEINGIDVSNLKFHIGKWYFLDTELKDFKKKVAEVHKQSGWKLKNIKLVSDELPEFLELDQIKVVFDEDEEKTYAGTHGEYQALYEPTWNVTPTQVIPAEVELTLIRELDVGNYSKPAEMKVSLKEDGICSSGISKTIDLASIVSLSEIEALLTPEFMHHTRPCSLTSKQVYQIIRQHVINNIDTTVARISSNYDFCFGVVKKVQTKPYTLKKESFTRSNRSYKPPRFVQKTVDTKDVKLFEMTWAGYKGTGGYGDYTCVEGWHADNLQELYDNIKRYLEELMQVINKPLRECEHCNGTGYENATIETNQR